MLLDRINVSVSVMVEFSLSSMISKQTVSNINRKTKKITKQKEIFLIGKHSYEPYVTTYYIPQFAAVLPQFASV
jgi:hypothetical protein